MMDILGECDHEHDTLELHHSPTASLEEVEKAEAELYKALNTQNKKLSKLDIIRVDLFLKEDYAITFNSILSSNNLNLDGLGNPQGDIIPGVGSRFILTARDFAKYYSHYITDAVKFIREHWGTEDNPLKVIPDDMIYGLTTLLCFINNAGNIKGGSSNGLNGRKKSLKGWMNSEMGRTSMRKWTHNCIGGHINFKIVHKIMEEYNLWALDNAPTMTITEDYLHENGILHPDKLLSKEQKNSLPNFPGDII